MAKPSATRAPKAGEHGEPSHLVRVAILTGPERFLLDAALHNLREAFDAHFGPNAVDTVRFDGARGPEALPDILDECRSNGLMQQFKLVVVNNADGLFKDEDHATSPASAATRPRGHAPAPPRKLLEAYAQSPADSAALVLKASTWRPGNLDKFVQQLGTGGYIKKADPVDAVKATAWARQRCAKRHGCEIQPPAAALLIQAVGPDLARIDGELEKLALAAGGRGQPITPAHVHALTAVTREEEFFGIQTTLLHADAAAALAHLRDLLDVSRHDPVPIRWAYAELARKVHTACRAAAQGSSPHAMLGVLKLWGPDARVTADLLAEIARRLPPDEAAALLGRVIQADAHAKSSVGDPERGLERLTIDFANTLAPSALPAGRSTSGARR